MRGLISPATSSRLLFTATISITLVAAGCMTAPPPPGDPTTLELGATGDFPEVGLTPATHSDFFDVSAFLPGTVATLTLDAIDVSVAAIAGSPNPLNGTVVLGIFYGADGVADPCAAIPEITQFNITVADGQVSSIDPMLRLVPPMATAEFLTGRVGLCVGATADVPLQLTVARLGLTIQ